jgi:hypothetical protein
MIGAEVNEGVQMTDTDAISRWHLSPEDASLEEFERVVEGASRGRSYPHAVTVEHGIPVYDAACCGADGSGHPKN